MSSSISSRVGRLALAASSHHHGAIRSDDSTDDVTVNNTKLRIYRHHHTTHHRWYEVGNRSKDSGDDDDTSADDDDVLNFRNHSGELDALNHTYCGMPNAITKNTQSSSNATASFQFYVDYLGAFCQSLEDCHIGCSSCGFAFRAALPRADVNLTFEERRDWRWHEQAGVNDYSCFGLHVVDSTARPQGPVPFDTMVRRFRARLANLTSYAPFLEHGTVLWADNADPYLRAFEAGGVPFLVAAWTSETGVPLYSAWVHVPHTLGVLEIVSRHVHDRFVARALRLDLEGAPARLPDAALAHAGVNFTADARGHALRPVAVSKVTSDMASVERYYREVLLADEVHYHESENNATSYGRLFHLREGNIAIRFVEAAGDDDVRDFEQIKKATHNASYIDYACGTDRYYDNHYAYSPPTDAVNMSLGALASRARDAQMRWHCEANGIYFWEPTGDTIYVSKTTNITARTDDAVHLEHDPVVVEELQFCEVYGKAQAQLCGQGYCRGTSISSTSSHMC